MFIFNPVTRIDYKFYRSEFVNRFILSGKLASSVKSLESIPPLSVYAVADAFNKYFEDTNVYKDVAEIIALELDHNLQHITKEQALLDYYHDDPIYYSAYKYIKIYLVYCIKRYGHEHYATQLDFIKDQVVPLVFKKLGY